MAPKFFHLPEEQIPPKSVTQLLLVTKQDRKESMLNEESLERDLNPRPIAYEAIAPPLSYRGMLLSYFPKNTSSREHPKNAKGSIHL